MRRVAETPKRAGRETNVASQRVPKAAVICLVRADQRPTACSSQNECDCDDVCRSVPSRRKDRRHGRREVCKQPEQRGGKLWLDNSRQGGDIVVCSTKLNRVKMVGQGSQTSSWLHSNLNKTGGLEKYKTWGLPPPKRGKTDGVLFLSFLCVHTHKETEYVGLGRVNWILHLPFSRPWGDLPPVNHGPWTTK